MKQKKQKKMISIKSKLLGTILPVVVLMVLVLVGGSYYLSKSIIQGYSRSLLASSVENQASEIEGWLNENLAAFQSVKQLIEGTNPREAELQEILDQYLGFNSNYPNGLYIADENGKLMASGSVRVTN